MSSRHSVCWVLREDTADFKSLRRGESGYARILPATAKYSQPDVRSMVHMQWAQ